VTGYWYNLPPPFQGETSARTRPRGVAPDWHAPRRWRVILAEFSSAENRYEPINEIASSGTDFSLPARQAGLCGFDFCPAQRKANRKAHSGLCYQNLLPIETPYDASN
jgi:hypothetical protein